MQFDAQRVATLLEDWLHTRADVFTRDPGGRIWAVPRAAGTTIHLRVGGELAEVFAGYTVHTLIRPSQAAPEPDILDCVEALIRGHAHDYFKATGLPLFDRSHGDATESQAPEAAPETTPARAPSVKGWTAEARRRNQLRTITPWPFVPPRPWRLRAPLHLSVAGAARAPR